MEKEPKEDVAAAEEGRRRWGKTRGGAHGDAGRRDGERTMRERAASRWETTTMAFRRWWTGGGGGKVIGGGGEDGLVGTSLDFGIGFFQKEFQRIALFYVCFGECQGVGRDGAAYST